MYLVREKPYYHTGLYIDIACWCIELILVISMGLYLGYLNRKQEARRVAMGLPANIKDISLMDAKEGEAYRLELDEILRNAGFDRNHFNEQAFDDITDFENPWFMYVI